MKRNISIFILVLCYCLFAGQVTANLALAKESALAKASVEAEKPYNPTLLQVNNLEEYEYISNLARKIMAHSRLYTYINKELGEFRKISPKLQAQFEWPEESKGLSETQILFLLQHVPEYWDEIEKYVKTVTPENATDPKISAFRKSLRDRFKEILAEDDKILKKFIKMNTPAEPLRLQLANDKTSISKIQIFIDRPSLENPLDPSSQVNPPDNLKEVIVDTIHTAKHSIYGNVFEFNLIEIADALIEANNRGVVVHFGIDSETTELADTNKEVVKKLQAQAKKSKNFHLTLVKSVGLNHQKIIVIDAGQPNARTIFSSGNFTQSCIGPEGDLVDIPAAQRPTRSKPNSNHMIIVDGALPALVTKQELVKTLDLGYRGRQYGISGSYIFSGPVDSKTGTPMEMALAFSPNGGMGEVNNDLTKRVIMLSRKGDILAKHFAFSSPELIHALESRILTSVKNGKGPGFRSLGDPPFAMQFWSGFLALSGLRINKDTGLYEKNPDSPLAKDLSAANLAKLQDQIRINPNEFGQFHEKLADGTSVDVSVKMHDKIFMNPTENWAIIGTSFNPSGSAENNQEQWIVVRDPETIRKIHGAFEYEYINAASNKKGYTVQNYAVLRNERAIPDLKRGKDLIDKSITEQNTATKKRAGPVSVDGPKCEPLFEMAN